MAQETFKNLLCSAIFGDETRLHSVGTAVPQNVAVLKITSEFRFDSIAGRELLAASLRIKATFTPRALSARRRTAPAHCHAQSAPRSLAATARARRGSRP